jgi:hypothetical protein
MPRIRGRRPGVYLSDGGTSYKQQVDRDRFAIAAFGWTSPAGVLPQLPRGFKPRRVSGLSTTSGRRGTAVVPTVASDVWTGTATTFDVEADDATIDTITIDQRFGEHPSLP